MGVRDVLVVERGSAKKRKKKEKGNKDGSEVERLEPRRCRGKKMMTLLMPFEPLDLASLVV